MAEYRDADGTIRDTTAPAGTVRVERRSNTGAIIGGIVLVALIVVGILFATGFWSADVKGGALPKVDVSTKAGEMPDVDVKSKEVVVGTKKETVDVPTVGVKDDDKK